MARRRKQRAELWLGLLVIVSSVLLLWGYFWLTGQPIGERGYTLFTVIPNAEGLEKGDPIQVAGVEVGWVRSVTLVNPQTIVVGLWVHRGIELPQDSRAVIQSSGVFGDRFVDIQPGPSQTLAVKGDTLAAGTVASLIDLAGEIGDNAERVLQQVEKLLADSAIGEVHGTIAALRSAVHELEQLLNANGDEFAAMSRSIRRTAETLEQTIGGTDVERTLDDLSATAAALQEAADELRGSATSLRSVAEKIDRGEGTIGLLVNDPGVYEDLRDALQSVGSLTQDIRENPGRYLKMSIF